MGRVTVWHKAGGSIQVEPVDAKELLAQDEYSAVDPNAEAKPEDKAEDKPKGKSK